jgi:hypothetical protein
MGHVFISFSSRDLKAAQSICNAIEERGYSCWISARDIKPGQNYQESIAYAITGASVFLLVFSQNSNNSNEIKKELSLASVSNLLVIPVRIEDILPTGAFKYELSTRQWIDVFDDWERAIGRIVDQIQSVDAVSANPASSRVAGLPPRRSRIGQRSRWWVPAAVLVVFAAGAWWWLTVPTAAALNHPDADPEKPETRVNAFTITVSVGQQVFKRRWDRVTPDRWVETYLESGARITQNVIKRMILADCSGTVVEEAEIPRKYAFIPDKGCPGMPFRISHQSPVWGVASHLENIE